MTSDADGAEVVAYYDRHCAEPGGILVVHIVSHDGEGDEFGVFSAFKPAMDWAHRFDADRSKHAVIVPYVLDEPDFGNVPPAAQN